MYMEISGIQVEVVRKKIKNMNLYVLPPDGRVRVSVPKFVSDKEISRFILTKIDWIRKNQKRIENRPCRLELKFETGELLYIFGKQYFLKVEYRNKHETLILEENMVILTVREGRTREQKEKIVNKWYAEMLEKEIRKYVPKWEERTNLYCEKWQIRNMKSRWGSCNTTKKKICINLQLVHHPIECLEYVILHELAHLKVNNHSKRFKDIMDTYMPNWRDTKKLLNGRK